MTALRVHERDLDRVQVMMVAAHIGADGADKTDSGWRFKCPACKAWDFGPNGSLVTAVTLYAESGYLPSGVLLGGVCMSCEHITTPEPREIEDEAYDRPSRAGQRRNRRGETFEEAWARWFAENPKVLASYNHQSGYWPYEPPEQPEATSL
ncbi:hypothetical protein QFZ75_008046 [Streptomyces sp. V3I8]|uniref:hypothetical protein n=1 Tax=Streptomyces sp. V3I8 TaxID=3042279 RepID=UPI0027860ABB|nr:hypothetical protein [Streptomyces sp. V3I8]MDQ1041544.1 hypothetical protein [Streptomyces sp. V3I8]